jgi:predicted small secreted protein
MRAIMTMAMVAAGLLLTACNTVKGVGQDVSSAGDAVAGAAEKAKN